MMWILHLRRSAIILVGLSLLFTNLLFTNGLALADSAMPAAAYADRPLANPDQERQARALMDAIRCLVCEGQSVGDSHAEMAGDMRALIRSQIESGQSPEQVKQWLIARYGNWITYDPPFDRLGAPLWIAPVVILLLGGFLVARSIRWRRRSR